MLLTITEKAKQKFQEQLEKRGHGVGVKIATKTTGCSGLGYVMEYIDEWPKAGVEDYSMFYAGGDARIFVMGRDYPYLNGLEIDYVRQGLNEGFEFHNPNERDRCGCGESFRV